MTKRECVNLYLRTMEALGFSPSTYDTEDFLGISNSVLEVLDAPTDRKAAQTIRWWGCWEGKHTATRFARTMRQLANKQETHHDS